MINITKIKHNPALIKIADTDSVHNGTYLDSLSSLFDNDLKGHSDNNYGVLVREDIFNFEFEIKSDVSLAYYCDTAYGDSAGNTSNSKFYFKKLNTKTNKFEGQYLLQKFYLGEWTYMGILHCGIYKCFATKPYVKFTEWKVFTNVKYCISSNSKYFQLKENNFIKDGTVPITKFDTSLFSSDFDLSDLFNDDNKIQKILSTSNSEKFNVIIKVENRG